MEEYVYILHLVDDNQLYIVNADTSADAVDIMNKYLGINTDGWIVDEALYINIK